MRDLNLICHYCGTRCEVEENECTDEFYTQCTNFDCGATGPGCSTPEQAAAAHLSVMPAPRWSKEHIPPPRLQRCKENMDPRIVRCVEPDLHCKDCEFCPIPLPLEPGQGGGA